MNNYGLKLAWRIFLLLLVLFATVYVIVNFAAHIRSWNVYHNPSAHMEMLEDYYQEGEYTLLSDYLEENGLYDASYQKYWEAADGYQYLTICSNLKASEYFSPLEEQLYTEYKNKLTALYENCQSENRSLLETFLSILK